MTRKAFLLLMLAWAILPATAGGARQQARATDRLSEAAEAHANEIQPPAQVMDLLGVRPGLVIGEVGAGRGRVTVHMAERVGAGGRIYANDIDADALEYLEHRCARLALSNVEIVHGAPNDARFPANRLDAIVMTWVYHHVDQRVALLRSLLPSLKPWGVVAMVEPTPATTEAGLAPLTAAGVADDARAAGFSLDAVIEGRLKSDNVFVLRPAVPDAPESHDAAKIRALWLEYLAWTKTAKGGTSPRDWAVYLDRAAVAGPEVRRRLQIVRAQFTEQPEGIELIYDGTYGKPLTGSLEKDGFKTAPNAFLVEATGTLKTRGHALDVGTGMGRNAVHLAKLGWDVTGIDLSAEGLKVLQANAAKAGLTIATVKTSYQGYDFGASRWDLVAMILSWAPIEEPAFLARLKASVKPGGYVIFEHVLQRAQNPFPPGVHALAAGQLRELFEDFEILVYRELEDYGDWGGPLAAHVRMVARKP
jgi:SAM-dependent methyltransferase